MRACATRAFHYGPRAHATEIRPLPPSHTSPDDHDALDALIARCGAGDADAFRRLYQLQSARLHGLALRITRQPSLAADAVHDALIQVWRRPGGYDPARGAAEAWLAGLVRYRAIDLMRKGGRETTGLELPETVDDAPNPLDRLLVSSSGAALHACLNTLDERHRRVILLAFVEGLTHTELERRLTTPLGTVKSWIRRGLMALRACLDR